MKNVKEGSIHRTEALLMIDLGGWWEGARSIFGMGPTGIGSNPIRVATK